MPYALWIVTRNHMSLNLLCCSAFALVQLSCWDRCTRRLPRLNDPMGNDEYLTSDSTLQVHRCFGLDHIGLSRKVAFPEESSSWKAMWISSWLGMRQSLNTEVSEKATVISNYPMSLSWSHNGTRQTSQGLTVEMSNQEDLHHWSLQAMAAAHS